MIKQHFRVHKILILIFLTYTAITAQEDKKFSATLSPLHLTAPIVELTGEYAINPKTSAAGILGYGTISEEDILGDEVSIPVLELGAQGRYYLLGNFNHGMPIGLEALWLKVFLPEQEDITVSVNGFGLGPFVGYKWAAQFGLTFDVQVGYQWLFAQAKAKDQNGNELEGSAKDGILLLNLNAGWSF